MRITGITDINENEQIYLMNNGEQYKVIDNKDNPPLCQWSKELEASSMDESNLSQDTISKLHALYSNPQVQAEFSKLQAELSKLQATLSNPQEQAELSKLLANFEIIKNLEINVDGSKATSCYEGCCETITGVSQLHPTASDIEQHTAL